MPLPAPVMMADLAVIVLSLSLDLPGKLKECDLLDALCLSASASPSL